MIRRPPRSTLFPTRRSSDLLRPVEIPRVERRGQPVLDAVVDRNGFLEVFDFDHPQHRPEYLLLSDQQQRSEEHTSELQSRSDLVCRLLLEKKKSNISVPHHT